MKRRCNNPRNKKYHLYGGRGIKVCERWNAFDAFLADMGERPSGKTLDRIDVNGDYEPSNCRWASPLDQRLNARNVKIYTYNGLTMHQVDWSKHLGLCATAVTNRIKSGWPLDRALSTPKIERGERK